LSEQTRTAPRTIDYYFTMVSPWAYLGHAAFTAVRHRRDSAVRYHPVNLATVFPRSGGLPLADRHPSRQRYRMLELQRWRERRALPLNLQPRFCPFDAALADGIVIAIVDAGGDPDRFLPAAFAAIWQQERNLADPEVLSELLQDGGFDAARVVAAARSESVALRYARSTQEALRAGVFGTPTYSLDGEIFWGQDRLDLLDEALASGRAPFET
jgi:2-hydroxychromene-2-carboxylate isomerase